MLPNDQEIEWMARYFAQYRVNESAVSEELFIKLLEHKGGDPAVMIVANDIDNLRAAFAKEKGRRLNLDRIDEGICAEKIVKYMRENISTIFSKKV